MVNKRKTLAAIILSVFIVAGTSTVAAQVGLTPAEEKRVEAAFQKANELLEKDKPREALVFYTEALRILPKDPSILFNAGMAAYSAEEYETALGYWKQLKAVDPEDWRGRTKLIQVYHALKRDADINRERDELFAFRKSGKVAELSEEDFYTREQFRVGKYRVMVFEHFELKGKRALRYAFMINRPDGTNEFKISLGSYDLTNSIWRETTKPTPKEGQRLFHLDAYFDGGGHATYGMYPEEPTYAQTREKVVRILEAQDKPVSSTTIVK